eukprot:UN02411
MEILKVDDVKDLLTRIHKTEYQRHLLCMIFSALLKYQCYDVTGLFMGVLKFAENNLRELVTSPTLSRIFDESIKCWAKARIRTKLVKK